MATLAGQTPRQPAPVLAALLERLDEDADDRAEIDRLKFALDRMALAVLRAMTTGVAETVEAPDHETARLLRRALAETAEHRPTDRLIRVVASIR